MAVSSEGSGLGLGATHNIHPLSVLPGPGSTGLYGCLLSAAPILLLIFGSACGPSAQAQTPAGMQGHARHKDPALAKTVRGFLYSLPEIAGVVQW